MKTIIETEIDGDGWIATTPHNAALEGGGATESHAINMLVAEIRKQIKDAGEKGVAWNGDAKPSKDKGKIARQVTGCWPPITKEPKPDKPAKRKDVTDGD